MKTIPYGRQHITEEDISAVADVLRSDFLTQGPKVHEFEEKFAQYIGSRYAVAVSNGTAALHLCAMALEVNDTSKVITTPITFAASSNCIRYCGGEVHFADIDPETMLLDLDKARSLLETHPKNTFSGIVPVDFSGHPVDMEAFRQLADEHNLWIIEDACHAPGGYFTDSAGQQQNCGNGKYADLAIFSFHPVKHIACGEGGMITTNRQDLYDKLLFLRTHGITKDPHLVKDSHGGWYYDMIDLGYNYRLTDMQSALGISQLSRADEGLQRRRVIANRYDEAFNGSHIRTLSAKKGMGHAYHLYVILTDNRKELYDFLKEWGIYAQVHYIPTHLLSYYRQLGWKEGDLPRAENYYSRCLSLPMYPSMTDQEQTFVIEKVLEKSQ
ncbi:MAG: UDP-4-amino-4,6-dideoxy-N-acetyl-beta-L-altrosamine transaminase [Saprospiraceae bacterium]|nr:UDP-4-amino-4,6-dideoxy-N-acetyl-beta-L-altrosamine transaminase [Saprospiraceae bacterium]